MSVGAFQLCLVSLFGAHLLEGSAEHTCAEIGCGNHDNVCYCESSCFGYGDCCPDFAAICPQADPKLSLRDLNFLVTTDIHAWIQGRAHEPMLNATLGDAVSTVEHLKEIASKEKRDVFFFDNGDINDGTGLSATAEDHVAYLSTLMQRAPYDAVNIGNHELYQRNGQGKVSGEACPITGLRDSGYIANWKGKYLTSNVVWASSGEPVGSRFTTLTGNHGTKLLVFGFLYNMEDHCDAVEVEDVATTLNSTWFSHALLEHGNAVDAIVVLAHMDYRDDLVSTIAKGIRSVVHERLPVQFLTGHSHRRGWARVDNFSSSYEAGCKLNTLGFISFDRPASETELHFAYTDIDGNTAQLARSVNASLEHLATPDGRAIDLAITDMENRLRLDAPLGCSKQRYKAWAPLNTSDSLWKYYMQTVLPSVLLNTTVGRARWAVVGNGALTYDIYPGIFDKNDAYTTSPYGNFWLTQHNITGHDLAILLAQLNDRSEDIHRMQSASRHGLVELGARLRQSAGWAVPDYISSGPLDNSTLYDVVYCDFDADNVESNLAKITGRPVNAVVFQPKSNTSSVLVDFFQRQPCQQDLLIV